jgi:hypothetical protein
MKRLTLVACSPSPKQYSCTNNSYIHASRYKMRNADCHEHISNPGRCIPSLKRAFLVRFGTPLACTTIVV